MKNIMKYLTVFMGVLACEIAISAEAVSDKNSSKSIFKRVPAEWEPQEAIWLQWPGYWEKDYEQTIAKVSDLVSRYQTLRILYGSGKILKEAKQAIRSVGADPDNSNIHWHAAKYDNSWMRDNGPVYVIEEDKFRIQNWKFDAWGGAFGSDIPFELDNSIPDQIGKILNIPVDHVNIVHERGNLEFNGSDSVILNWSTIGDPFRNIAYPTDEPEPP